MKPGELFDTCILIDYLDGSAAAKDEIDGAVQPAISQITWIEVMVGADTATEVGTRAFLRKFSILGMDDAVSEVVVGLRKNGLPGLTKKPKLPDAIIAATARHHGRVLVTRNTKDFPQGTAGVRIPAYATRR